MANAFHSEVSLANKTGGKGQDSPRGKVASPSLNMKARSWPGLPGKTGPNRSAGYTKPPQHTQVKGL